MDIEVEYVMREIARFLDWVFYDGFLHVFVVTPLLLSIIFLFMKTAISVFLPDLFFNHDEKAKRKPLEDEFYDEKPKRYFEIGDDGELVEWVNTHEE